MLPHGAAYLALIVTMILDAGLSEGTEHGSQHQANYLT